MERIVCENSTWARITLTPPDVDPVDAPTKNRNRSSIWAAGAQKTKSPGVAGPVALVGRSSPVAGQQPQIVLDADTSVSRRHAQFVVGGRNLTVVDLSSTNGTYVLSAGSVPDAGSPPLVPGVPRELYEGDRVYLGAWTRLTVRSAVD